MIEDLKQFVIAGEFYVDRAGNGSELHHAVFVEGANEALALTGLVGGVDDEESRLDAERLALLINAFQGVPTSLLKKPGFMQFMAGRTDASKYILRLVEMVKLLKVRALKADRQEADELVAIIEGKS